MAAFQVLIKAVYSMLMLYIEEYAVGGEIDKHSSRRYGAHPSQFPPG